jgi:bacillithiol system protein YtxJ
VRILDTLDDLDSAVAGSSARPLVVFKHSLTCGTSARALAQVESVASDPSLDADIVVVHVQNARDVSNAIAARFGVRHESPQVIVINDGRAVWHASHWRVTAAAILDAVRNAVPDSSATAV